MKYFLISILFISQLLNCVKKDKSDSDFTLDIYENFIKTLTEDKNIIVVPLKDFYDTIDSTKIVVALRHDVDRDIKTAKKIARIEYKYKIQSSYYILHTADYYLRYYKNKELKWLRNKGINNVGSASHGSHFCDQFGYKNNYFFEECNSITDNYPNITSIINHGDTIRFTKGNFEEFQLEYEAYYLNNNKY
jgi:hypothetical protein